jgi:hypothetical protein
MTDAIGFLRETKIFSKDEYSNYFILPGDYMHLLSCSVIYDDKASCGSSSSSYGARRMTSDYKGQIFNNYYLKPTKQRPYYMVTNNRLEIFNNGKEFDKVSIDYLKKP